MILFVLKIIGLKYHDLSTDHYTGTAGVKILGVLFLLSLIVERVVEAFLNLWRGEERANIEGEIKILEDESKDNPKMPSEELNGRKRELIAFKTSTQISAFFCTFIIGLLLSLSGFNLLTTFFDLGNEEDIVINKDLDSKVTGLLEVVKSDSLEFNALFVKLPRKAQPDTFIVDKKVSKNLIPAINQVDTALQVLKYNNLELTSKRPQRFIFYVIGILITALMISGGSEAVHKIFVVYDAFLRTSKKKLDDEQKESDSQVQQKNDKNPADNK